MDDIIANKEKGEEIIYLIRQFIKTEAKPEPSPLSPQ